MKQHAYLISVAGILAACTQPATLTLNPDDLPAPSQLVTDCAADYRERGRPHEKPLDSGPDARAAIDSDLRLHMPGGLADLKAAEPLCFYSVPEDRLLMRDGRGVEYYFRQVSRWQIDRVDVPTSGQST